MLGQNVNLKYLTNPKYTLNILINLRMMMMIMMMIMMIIIIIIIIIIIMQFQETEI
jgi:hypothetical protein